MTMTEAATDNCNTSALVTYGVAEMCDATGVSYRQLDYWATAGYIPGGNPGTGENRRWTWPDMEVVGYILTLLDIGFALPLAAATARRLVDTRAPVIIGDGMVIVHTDALHPGPS